MRADFVVYAHYTLDTNELFYIGEGTVKRSKSSCNRNRWWKFKVKKHGFRVEILHKNLTKLEAEDTETKLIQHHKDIGTNIVNICIGPMHKNPWILNVPKELHPMYGTKRPECSKRITEWNKEHYGINSPVFGLKRNDLSERNRTGEFKRFVKSIICNETGEQFQSITNANIKLGLPIGSTCINKNLSGNRTNCKGFTWSYFNTLINGIASPE